jgi:TerC family integral membrane protein
MSLPTSLLWLSLFAVVGVAIALDLLAHRRGEFAKSPRAALVETFAWIALALVFDLWIFHVRGRQASVEFLTGYLIEKILSIDNIFLFLVIFRSFQIPARTQHRVLYFGVAAALALRAVFVFAGVALLDHFKFVIYIFGAILLVTAVRMLLPRGEEVAGPTWITRIARQFLPVSERAEPERFFVRENGKRLATSLVLALIAIEATDVIFAADSVPAVLSITRDTFIAYSSNVFAILGLRAIYFVMASVLRKVRFLRQGLAAVLVFTGLKMLLSERVPISDGLSLAIIAGILALTAIASALSPTRQPVEP